MEELFTPDALHVAAMVLLKMGISVILGGAIGLEREMHGRPAGLRTHMLVAIGVTLFCIISTAYKGADPTRISAQVVTGIGFLGAGAILRMGAEVRGLTSAASIWATSAVAMAVARGGPYLLVAAVSTVLVLLTLGYVEQIEKRYRPRTSPTEMVVVLRRQTDLQELIAVLNRDGFEVRAARLVQTEPTVQAALQVYGSSSGAIRSAFEVTGVTDAHWNDGA